MEKESGEGKSLLYTLIERGVSKGTLGIECELPFTLATRTTLDVILSVEKRHIIMIDESAMLVEKLIQKVNKSKHLFICISRAMPFKSEYPLKGLYQVVKEGAFLDVIPVNWFPLYKGDTDKNFKVVVESDKDKSEGELLSVYIPDIVASRGVGNIERKLRNSDKDTLVFADLGNIGRQYHILKRCQQNPNIRFYPYECFEQLLFDSKYVKDNGKHVKLNVFDYISTEEYFEKSLERATQGTAIEYKHGKPLPVGYLDKKNFEDVFDSKVGQKIKNYIKAKGFDK